jgi:hypothetical protein
MAKPTGHAPGPWTAGPPTEEGHIPIREGADGYLIATVWADDSRRGPADARLIARAPTMLGRLREAEKLIAKYTYPQPDKPDSAWAILVRIRGEIAEATRSNSQEDTHWPS